MIDKKKNGFGAYEMLTVCVMVLIIMVVLLAYVFKTDYNEKYKVMQYNARMFGLSVTNFSLTNEMQDVYYLQEMIDKKIYSEIKNPFQGEKYCNSEESKVEIRDNKKYVTLKCGNYLIYKEDFLHKSYKIYQVSEWGTRKRGKEDQTATFYNYIVDGKKQFSNYFEKDYFLYRYNLEKGGAYSKLTEIPKDVKIEKKTMYRQIKVVKK